MRRMRRLTVIVLLLAVLPGAAGAAGVTSAAPHPANGGDGAIWTFCFEDRDIPPWRTRVGAGLNIDLLEAASRQIGLRLRYVALPWRRCQSGVAKGEIDGLFAISHSGERERLWVYPPGEADRARFRMFQDSYILLRRSGDAVTAVDGRVINLQGRIGAQPGYSVVADLRQQGLDVDDGTPEPARIVRKLLEGRLGAAALGMNDWRDLQAQDEPALDGVEALAEPLFEKDYFLVVSHRRYVHSPRAVNALWDAIAAKRDGVVDAGIRPSTPRQERATPPANGQAD